MRLCWIFILWINPVQQDNFWHVLAQVGFEKKKDKQGYVQDVPVFTQYLKEWHGKRIQLKGYIIPAGEVGDERYMFSALPFNICYFCGAAGPETVVELETRQKILFSSKPMVLEGTLFLNVSDINVHIETSGSKVTTGGTLRYRCTRNQSHLKTLHFPECKSSG
jgi:hypothetical protein